MITSVYDPYEKLTISIFQISFYKKKKKKKNEYTLWVKYLFK